MSLIALVLLWTSTFEKVLTFVGFTIALFTCLSVIGVFILRNRNPGSPDTYKTTGFPVTPLLFLLLNIGMISFLLWKRPIESLAGVGILIAGFIVYLFVQRGSSK